MSGAFVLAVALAVTHGPGIPDSHELAPGSPAFDACDAAVRDASGPASAENHGKAGIE